MFELHSLLNLNEFFEPLRTRGGQRVYFYRISCYHPELDAFLLRYFEEARLCGVVIEGKIPNPSEKNLAYYEEIMGLHFELSPAFLTVSLKKWLPRMDETQRTTLANALFDVLNGMRGEGKNDDILKNAYIKLMCWLYYKLERIVGQLGKDPLPKILYEGSVSSYELKLFTVLARSGCDVLLLQYEGDHAYQKLDPSGALSMAYSCNPPSAFPAGFSIQKIQSQVQQQVSVRRLCGEAPLLTACTNVWLSGEVLQDLLKPASARGEDPKLFYNALVRIRGAQDKLSYASELYQFQFQLKTAKRRTVILDQGISLPTTQEVAAIRRKNYNDVGQALLDLSSNLQYPSNPQLQGLMVKAFADLITEQARVSGINLSKLTNRAVHLLCWLKRYQSGLFSGWKAPEVSCFIYLGGCKNESEALFLRFLAKLPVDVLILCPDRSESCCLSDTFLFEKSYAESLSLARFPGEDADAQVGTAAFQAERELDSLLYQDSGIYRNQQHDRAISVTLQTTYEEIAILWDQELKYRPNFSVAGGVVTIPCIFAKVSGVKDGLIPAYWSSIKSLETDLAFMVKNPPLYPSADANPVKPFATEFFKNKKLQKEKIKNHRTYLYGYLREEIQAHILDKLQALLDLALIKGTFENGMEYTIISVILNLPKDILRLLQKFDFTRKNPKLIYINTLEQLISLEDAILTAFLNLAGFDILFYAPTGYQTMEPYFNKKAIQEHQIGEYLYDMPIPNFRLVPTSTKPSWREKLFGII